MDRPTDRDPNLASTVPDAHSGALTVEKPPHPVDVASAVLDVGGFAERYEMHAPLGRGGMGEVRSCRDARIGREVALKVLLPELEQSSTARARFLREVRIQGQLEHPSVVPVHDLGVAPGGGTYFTMKRVRGSTLEQILTALASEDEAVAARHTRHKLLSAFSRVCLAVDFAHARGVVHRDLKPANVMLGDFGEVYVLDWGLARIVATDSPPDEVAFDDVLTGGGGPATAHGTILGTPGYLAPEQIRPSIAALGPACDVWALGAILFEMLTLRPVVQANELNAMLLETVKGVEARPSVRAPERAVPPELEAICVRACALLPADRYPSARALHDAIEGFLEGELDVERRRAQSVAEARDAERTLAAGLEGRVPYERARGDAMRALGRALALDPDNTEATRTVLRLLTEPPREIPAEVEQSVQASGMKILKDGARAGSQSLWVWFLFLPAFLWLGVRDVPMLALVLGSIGVAAVLSWTEARRPVFRRWMQVVVFGLIALAFGASSRLFGPFVLVPTLAAALAISMQAHPFRAERWMAVGLTVASIAVPFGLELAGVLPRSYAFEDGRFVILPQVNRHAEVPTLVFLLAANLAVVLSPSVFSSFVRRALTDAERRLHLQAWHLRRLMPE